MSPAGEKEAALRSRMAELAAKFIERTGRDVETMTAGLARVRSGEATALAEILNLAHRASGCLLELAVLERLQRDPTLHELLLEHLAHCTKAVFGGGAHRELEVVGLDGRARALEVVAGGQLPLGLVERVAHLLLVDLGDDIKGRHGRESSFRYCVPPQGSVPEWPKGAGCKPAGASLRRFKSFPAHQFSRSVTVRSARKGSPRAQHPNGGRRGRARGLALRRRVQR